MKLDTLEGMGDFMRDIVDVGHFLDDASVGSAVVRVTTDASTYEVTVVKTGEEWKTTAVTLIAGGDQ